MIDLYVVTHTPHLGLVKIGVTTCLPYRLKQLESSSGFAMRVLAVRQLAERCWTGRQIEQWWHARLRRRRVRGEWFQAAEPVARAIANEVLNVLPKQVVPVPPPSAMSLFVEPWRYRTGKT